MTLTSVYRSKRVFVTGHTGFKGAWLTSWLLRLGAEVAGYSIDVPTKPSIFSKSALLKKVHTCFANLNQSDVLESEIFNFRPDFIFHLAAQPLVREAYQHPLETIRTNALGTVHLLEVLRKLDWPCTLVLITSDKVYDNVEWLWGYRENDPIGGKDPYSASKGMAELAIRTYFHSYFSEPQSPLRMAIARAGNVIGGGDWALDRIVPDAVRAWSEGRELLIRNPGATRPWQHVLEPVGAYLLLGAKLSEDVSLHGEAFNFGPSSDQNISVRDLIEEMQKYWSDARLHFAQSEPYAKSEAGLLKLNCDKALHLLGWHALLDFSEVSRMTIEWYRKFYNERMEADMLIELDLRMYEERFSGFYKLDA